MVKSATNQLKEMMIHYKKWLFIKNSVLICIEAN
jgi:hypothetical protein